MDIKIDIYNSKGVSFDKTIAPLSIFGKTEADIEKAKPLIHQVITAQRAAARQGTHSTKTRAEVSGGGAKPFRQKGTGRARQGSSRAPQMKGGGVVFGPVPRDHSKRTNKRIIFSSLCYCLSDRANAKRIYIVSDFGIDAKPNTKRALNVIEKILGQANKSNSMINSLVVISRDEFKIAKSLANPINLHLIYEDQLNSYDILVNEAIIFTEKAYNSFIERTKAKAQIGK
ncbi:MAG: 50S ribosomal protein L4 [Bifidobacteriaceae bacterium]|jgi:large subunit ribosomal protein L4|nr:50S ribosomal protein L4 [Bifidobacteriaceae bacterium]